MICSLRIPDVLQARIDTVAGKEGRSKWIIEACRMRLDQGAVAGTTPGPERYAGKSGSTPEASTKPTMHELRLQDLRDICAGAKRPPVSSEPLDSIDTHGGAEVPICSKKWWEDGTQYECLMDKGHKEQKHGLRGMVRALDV